MSSLIGANVTFSNIEHCRSIHAHAVKEWMKAMVANLEKNGTVDLSVPSEESMLWSTVTWFMKEMPLATKAHLFHLGKAKASNPNVDFSDWDPRYLSFTMGYEEVMVLFCRDW